MIVKNGERDLPECLQSVQGIVDEIVIADTGSSDASVDIARRYSAKVLNIPWENDFSKARNTSLAEVRAEWVLMMDADERLDPDARSALPALLAKNPADGYQVTIRNYVSNLDHKLWDRPAHPNDGSYTPARQHPAYVDHENVRLFRRDPEIYFTGRVHETVGWRILETKRKLGAANFIIHHMGMVKDDEERARKILFYLELGRQKVAEMPENSQAHFELGVSEMENLGNVESALLSFVRSCELNAKFGEAWFFQGVCHSRLNNPSKALECFQKAHLAGHSTAWLAEMIGDVQYNLGNFEAARGSYQKAVRIAPANVTVESKMGLAESRMGRRTSGLRRLRHAVEADSANPDLHDRLIMVELWLGHIKEGAQAAERKLAQVKPSPIDFIRAASIRSKLGDSGNASRLLREGLRLFPDSGPLQQSLAAIETPDRATVSKPPSV
jgi:glycosyltransferase involved in cell wall biosynthesis